MNRIVFVLAALAAGAVLAMPAAAITDGQPDQGGHPYVGLMVAQDADGDPLWRCSGTLLSSEVFLTAGHCTAADEGGDVAHVEIWFNSGSPTAIPLGAGYPAAGDHPCAGITGYPCTGDGGGAAHTHPRFPDAPFYVHDVGVVVLDEPFASPNGVYGTLPTVGQLNSLKPRRSTTFTAVGYGLQKSFPTAASWKTAAVRRRMVATPHLLQINRGIVGSFSLLLSNNARTGGTCFGDSGGPNFLGTTNLVAGITSFGLNGSCAGTGGVFRTDQADVLAFINGYLN